jgi:hypothetical protein
VDVIGWLVVGAALVVGVPALAYFAQDGLLFLPQLAAPPPGAARVPRPVEELSLATPDGVHVRGWFVRGRATPAPLVVYYGGNAENVAWQALEPWPEDWSLALVNYRGYGSSEGKPSERALFADAELAFDALARQPGDRRCGVHRDETACSRRDSDLALRQHGRARAAALSVPADRAPA